MECLIGVCWYSLFMVLLKSSVSLLSSHFLPTLERGVWKSPAIIVELLSISPFISASFPLFILGFCVKYLYEYIYNYVFRVDWLFFSIIKCPSQCLETFFFFGLKVLKSDVSNIRPALFGYCLHDIFSILFFSTYCACESKSCPLQIA